MWSPIEDVTLRVGGPRVGKSGELAGRILDAPGAVIATSTRTDLVGLTAMVRQQMHGPVSVFNPCGLGKLESTIVFDPLTGCEDPKTAVDRATDLLSGSTGAGLGRLGGAGVLDRAGRPGAVGVDARRRRGGASMRHVQRWVADPDTYAEDVQRALRRSPQEAIGTDVLQFLNTNERTQTSITATIMPALALVERRHRRGRGRPRPAGPDAGRPRPVAVDAIDARRAHRVDARARGGDAGLVPFPAGGAGAGRVRRRPAPPSGARCTCSGRRMRRSRRCCAR